MQPSAGPLYRRLARFGHSHDEFDYIAHLNSVAVAAAALPDDPVAAAVALAADHARLRGGTDGRAVLVVYDVHDLKLGHPFNHSNG